MGGSPERSSPSPLPFRIPLIARYYARYGITPRAFIDELEKIIRPDAVLVTSMMTYWYPGVFEAIRIIKERLPGVPVILGGIYATLCTAHARKYSGADHIISHEGEMKILRLFSAMWDKPLEDVRGTDDLDTLPYPCFDLMTDLRSVSIRTSRGCPYRCTYCASHFLCNSERRRSPVKVADEIEFWKAEQGAAGLCLLR